MTRYDPNTGNFRASMGEALQATAIEQQRQNERRLGVDPNVSEVAGIYTVMRGSNALLIGGAPSISQKIDVIREAREAGFKIFAVNDVPMWMVENGLGPPDYHGVMDPRPTATRYWNEEARPLEAHVLAWAVHPALFDVCRDHGAKVIAFRSHPDGDKPVVCGGSTVVGRMLPFIAMLGYERIHGLGLDSSFDSYEMHAYPHHNREAIVEMCAAAGYPKRRTTPNLAAQAWELPQIAVSLYRFGGHQLVLYDTDTLAGDYMRAAAEGKVDFTMLESE